MKSKLTPWGWMLALLSIAAILTYVLCGIGLTACSTAQLSQAQGVGSALIADVAQGTVIASDAYAVYQAGNQGLTASNVNSGGLSVPKVIAAAQAINQTIGSPATASLTLAANTLVSDVNGQILALKEAGVTSPTAITNSVSTSGAATVQAIAALPAPPTSMLRANPKLSIRPRYGWMYAENVY